MRPLRLLAGLVALALVGAACSGDVGTPAPTSTATPGAVVTPSPSPAPSPTPVATAPLTGEGVADAGVVSRPVLAVKIENTAAARPQAGLEVADIVYEELVEGGVTRFIALFQSRLPEVVGPIRSARLVDVAVLPSYDGVLAYSGAREEVTAALHASGMALLVDDGGDAFYRDPSRPRSHDLMGRGPRLLAKGAGRGAVEPARSVFTFSDTPPDGAVSCSPAAPRCGQRLEIGMSGAAVAGWTYDADAGSYRRDQNGRPSVVAGDGSIGAANVVQLGMNIGPGGCCDGAGSRFVATQVFGEGEAVVLRDGRRYRARWRKPDAASDLELLSADGSPFPMSPGATWIHLAPVRSLPD